MPLPYEPISLTKGELKMLEALVELEREEREGSAQRITIYDSTNAVAVWAKIGKWAWKNRYKLLAVGQALYDLLGIQAAAQPSAGKIDIRALSLPDDSSLEDLIAARDQVHRAMEKQEKKGGQ